MMSIYKSDEEVFLLVKAFEERTLPKADWTHAAHLTVGLYYSLNSPPGVAKNLMRDGIYWLNDRHGTPNTESSGYHETLTFFWMTTIANFLEANGRDGGLAKLANELLAVCSDAKLPLQFYSRELLFSAAARARRVEPDLPGVADLNTEIPAFA
jgi:hypothetical protein